jgi:hypothetical protein
MDRRDFSRVAGTTAVAGALPAETWIHRLTYRISGAGHQPSRSNSTRRPRVQRSALPGRVQTHDLLPANLYEAQLRARLRDHS